MAAAKKSRVAENFAPLLSLPNDNDEDDDDDVARRHKLRWTAAEDMAIMAAVQRLGTRWPEIAAHLPGRSDDSVRNRWHRLKRAKVNADTNDGRAVTDLMAAAIMTDLLLPQISEKDAAASRSSPSSELSLSEEPSAELPTVADDTALHRPSPHDSERAYGAGADASEDSMSTKTPTPPHDPYGGAADDDHQADYDLDGLASFIDAGDDGVLDSFVSGVLQEFDDHAGASAAAASSAAAGAHTAPAHAAYYAAPPAGYAAVAPADPGAAGSVGPFSYPLGGPPISPPFSPPSPPGYNPLAVADCRGRARVISLGGVPFVCVFDERWSGAALTRQQLERMLAASQPATLAAARKAECAPEESYAIDPLTLAFKDRAVRARYDEIAYDAGYAGYRICIHVTVFIVFLLSGAASVERFGLDFWSRPDYYLSMWQEPVNIAVVGGMCGWTYVSPADSRKYYPSYVTAIYFIGIALVCCNIHMVTRRCPRQPGLMCDPVVTNDTYSDPAIVDALFWFRAVLVIAPALAAAIFRVRFPALALGTTLTTLYCAFVFLWAAVVEEEEVGDLPLPRQAAFIVLPPSIMMVICYMILSANLKAFTAFDSNRRQAAAVEEVVRTVGETSIAVTARPNKADAPAYSARAG